jgi:hypothetical protein
MREPLHQAKAALRAANRALERMKDAHDVEEFEDAWQDYLGSLEKSWVKVERSCQAYRNRFQPWQGKFARRRKKDPLLRYLKHARHADEHTIEEIIERVPGYRTLNPAYGNSWHIEHLEIRDGDIVSYSGDKPVMVQDIPDRVELRRFKESGTWYNPPTQHLDKALNRQDPISVAELGLRFYTNFVEQAEEKFFT